LMGATPGRGARAAGIAFLLGLVLCPQAAAQEENVAGFSLVRVIETSEWSPPSPDPGGLAYQASTRTILVADSEVEETPWDEGINVFEMSRRGRLKGGFSHHPRAEPIRA